MSGTFEGLDLIDEVRCEVLFLRNLMTGRLASQLDFSDEGLAGFCNCLMRMGENLNKADQMIRSEWDETRKKAQ